MIPEAAVEAAESAVMTAMLERPGADGYVDGYREYARAALEAAAPHMERANTAEMATIIREHWAAELPHPMYPTYVKCMKHGCEWDGRFLGDISEHAAELIAARMVPAQSAQPYTPQEFDCDCTEPCNHPFEADE